MTIEKTSDRNTMGADIFPARENATTDRRKKLAIVTFKYVETHPRVNRIANTFKECDYDVTVYGLSHKPNISTNSNGIKFVTFPMRSTVRAKFTNLILFPGRFVMGSLAALTLIYCRIRKI